MALNDPHWGKKNSEGPPDLDELWRRFNQRLSEMFGGRAGPRLPQGRGGRPFGGRGGLLLLAVAAAWLLSGLYKINEGQQGVILRFGKYVETTQPGLRWHMPWPIESQADGSPVNISQVRTVEIGYRNNVKSKVPQESLMLTDDENIIDIQFAVQYTIRDPEDFLFNNRNPEDTVMGVAETATREIVGKNKMDFVLYEGRSEIVTAAQKLMQQILDRYKTGITISRVTMQNAQPPEQVQAAFDDAVKAGQDRERSKNEGQAYANDVIPRARGNASRMLEEAAGYAARVVANAEGDVSRFKQIRAEYEKAPDVTRERMYLDTMQQILGVASKVMIDQKSGSNNLFYVPLDKLLPGAPAPVPALESQESAASRSASSPEAAPVPDTAGRSRDAFRSREREAR